jgi:N-acetylglutamate synthase-like GNAT family acetyltransferase
MHRVMTKLQIVSPHTATQWQAYFEVRWRLLRSPWQQPKGSEQDEFEQIAFHVMAKNEAGEVMGVGRIHPVTDDQWQIRYMAVEERCRNTGVGSRILKALEDYAQSQGAAQIVLNSRSTALNFYVKHGYRIIDDAPTMFGVIAHKKMQKSLRISRARP